MGNQSKKICLNQQALHCLTQYILRAQSNIWDEALNKKIGSIVTDIPTLFESIKILHFIFKNQAYIHGLVCLRALKVVQFFMETCQIPCFNLLQVYILPYLYLNARRIFEQNSQKQIINANQHQLTCYRIIIQSALIKPRRLYENQEMQQFSLAYSYLKNLAYLAFEEKQKINSQQYDEIDQIIDSDLRAFIYKLGVSNPDQFIERVSKHRKKFEGILQNYGNYQVCKMAQQYSTFSIQLLKIEQRQGEKIQQNNQNLQQTLQRMLNQTNFPLLFLTYPPMAPLFQTLDPILTYPLNQTIFSILQIKKTSKYDFVLMAQMLKILNMLIVWGDLEAYLNVVYSERLEYIANRIAEVDPTLPFQEAAKTIFIELGDRLDKAEFYREFLVFLEIFCICKFPQIDKQLQSSTLRKIQKQLKQKSLKFPSIQISKYRSQFITSSNTNIQRNKLFFRRVNQMNVKESIKTISKQIQLKDTPNIKKSTMMSSINLVAVLKGQLQQLYLNVEKQYETILEKQRKKMDKGRMRAYWGSLMKKLGLLEREVKLNQQEQDPFVQEFLQQITDKSIALCKKIRKCYRKFQEQLQNQKNNKNMMILEETSYNIEQCEVGGGFKKIKQQKNDGNSEIVLLTQSKQCYDKETPKQNNDKPKQKYTKQQDPKQDSCKIKNIQSVTSEYGLFQIATESPLQKKCEKFSTSKANKPEKQQKQLKQLNEQKSQKQQKQNGNANKIAPQRNLQNILQIIKLKQVEGIHENKVFGQVQEKNRQREVMDKLNKNSESPKKRRVMSRTERFVDCIRSNSQQTNIEMAKGYLTARQNSKSRLKFKGRSNSQANIIQKTALQKKQIKSNLQRPYPLKLEEPSSNPKQNIQKLANNMQECYNAYGLEKRYHPQYQTHRKGHHLIDVVSKQYARNASNSSRDSKERYIRLGKKQDRMFSRERIQTHYKNYR